MEKSQAKGIESSCFASRPASAFLRDAWKNPKQRELKVDGMYWNSRRIDSDAWKNPKQRELKGNTKPLTGRNAPRCMEKSQAKGIESRYSKSQKDFAVERCMEKSQAKGIERLWIHLTYIVLVCDAWKNPKQRELKDVYWMLRTKSCEKMHGKIPSKGN